MKIFMGAIVVAWFLVGLGSLVWPVPVEIRMYLMGAGTVAMITFIGTVPRGWWKSGVWDKPTTIHD